MSWKNSQTFKPHVLIIKFTDKLDLRTGENRTALSNVGIYYKWEYIKSLYNNNKFKISAPIWNDKLELPDRQYSVSDSQDYFEYILKNHRENIENPSVKIYVNKIENRITFKIKNGYSLELLTLKQWNYLEVLKIKQLKIKTVKISHVLKLQK